MFCGCCTHDVIADLESIPRFALVGAAPAGEVSEALKGLAEAETAGLPAVIAGIAVLCVRSTAIADSSKCGHHQALSTVEHSRPRPAEDRPLQYYFVLPQKAREREQSEMSATVVGGEGTLSGDPIAR